VEPGRILSVLNGGCRKRGRKIEFIFINARNISENWPEERFISLPIDSPKNYSIIWALFEIHIFIY
jgi:hypothetical protein